MRRRSFGVGVKYLCGSHVIVQVICDTWRGVGALSFLKIGIRCDALGVGAGTKARSASCAYTQRTPPSQLSTFLLGHLRNVLLWEFDSIFLENLYILIFRVRLLHRIVLDWTSCMD